MERLPAPSPEQLRAARAWLGLSQVQLVAAADELLRGKGFSKRTLIRLEAGLGQVPGDTLSRCGDVLRMLGVEFLFEEGRPAGIRVPPRMREERGTR